MNNFDVKNACPGCGYAGNGIESPFNKAQRCMARALDEPLRCVDCVDPAERAAWPQERYELDGKSYRPVTSVVTHHSMASVPNPNFDPEKEVSDTNPREIEVPTSREEIMVDEAKTIAGGPLTPPKTIPHVHRTCQVCGTTWPELLKA